MKIKSLHIYPIKALRGISLQRAYAHFAGFQNDRRYMLIDENNHFISQRTDPRLALFKVDLIEEDFISLCYNDQCKGLDMSATEGETMLTDVWGRKMSAIEPDKMISEWFSNMLHIKCRLVKQVEDGTHIRHYGVGSEQTAVSFADGYPYLVAGTGSLDFLNSKLDRAIPMNRFRPNIVIETKEDAEEDGWTEYDLGELRFKNVKPCARCNVTTINQELGKSTGKEPLKTLGTYRRNKIHPNLVNFGVYAIPLSEGWVEVSPKE